MTAVFRSTLVLTIGLLCLAIASVATTPSVLDSTRISGTTEASPALTSSLLIVILDGLRLDVAEDDAVIPNLERREERNLVSPKPRHPA